MFLNCQMRAPMPPAGLRRSQRFLPHWRGRRRRKMVRRDSSRPKEALGMVSWRPLSEQPGAAETDLRLVSPPASPSLPHFLSPLCLPAKPDSAHRPLLRTNSEDQNQPPNAAKEKKAACNKSSDSGEEADKDFILIWVQIHPGSGYIFFLKSPLLRKCLQMPAGPCFLSGINNVSTFDVEFWEFCAQTTFKEKGWGGAKMDPHHLENQTVKQSPTLSFFLQPLTAEWGWTYALDSLSLLTHFLLFIFSPGTRHTQQHSQDHCAVLELSLTRKSRFIFSANGMQRTLFLLEENTGFQHKTQQQQ